MQETDNSWDAIVYTYFGEIQQREERIILILETAKVIMHIIDFLMITFLIMADFCLKWFAGVNLTAELFKLLLTLWVLKVIFTLPFSQYRSTLNKRIAVRYLVCPISKAAKTAVINLFASTGKDKLEEKDYAPKTNV